MKNKWLLIGIIVIVILALGCGSYFLFFNKKSDTNPKNEDTNEIIKTHIAYIKINPSIKLEYTEKCTNNVCEEPIVTKYELLNEDAKEMFKNINLLDGDNTLSAVIDNICETAKNNNIEVKDVEIISDWDEINTYLEENKEDTNTWNYNVEKVETSQIETIIENKVIEEENTKEADLTIIDNEPKEIATPEETPNNNTSTNTTTPKDDNIIRLSDNVKYNLGGEGFCCNNCFSDSLIQEIKNAKGYYVTKADNSTISFEKISGLSGSYNSPSYYGEKLNDKLIAAGGENCSGFGGAQEVLTMEICNKYHLNCEN